MNDRQGAKDAKGQEPGEVYDDLARRVIGAAIEVHRHLGPGFAGARVRRGARGGIAASRYSVFAATIGTRAIQGLCRRRWAAGTLSSESGWS